MKRLFLTLSLLLCCFLGLNAQKKQAVSVLYVGGSAELETMGLEVKPDAAVLARSAAERTASFERFLKKHFKTVKVVDAKDYHYSMSDYYDVTILDGTPAPIAPGIREVNDRGYMERYALPQYFPLDFNRPIITIANAGEELGRRVGTKNDWYCLCLEDYALGWNATHPIFQGPVKVNIETTMEPTPAGALEYAKLVGETLPAQTEMFLMQNVNYVNNPSYRIGMVSRPGGYLDSPETEVISGGKCAKSIDAVAIGRHANWLTWGFSASPTYMTETAKALFVNAIVYMKQFAGQHPIARKLDEGVSTRDHIAMLKNLVTRESWKDYNKSNMEFNHMVDSLKAVIKSQREKDGKVDPNIAIYENFPAQEMVSYRDYVKQQARGLYTIFGEDVEEYSHYYDKNYGYFYCPAGAYDLVIDEEARYFGIPNNDIRLLDKCISVLEQGGEDVPDAQAVLKRYTLCRFETPAQWREWFERNRSKLFFTESGGYLWLVNTFENVPGNDYRVRLAEQEEEYMARKAAGGRRGAPVSLTDDRNPVYLQAEAVQTDKGKDIVIYQKIHPGYHTYAVVPSDEVFVVTTVEITLPDGYEKVGPLYLPEAALLDASGTTVYRGTGEFRQAIQGQGEGEAIVKVTYQCCNNNTCLVPETKTFTVKL
ncbi:MAG: hypothetical protein IJU08_00950 [Bacteroidales bacterium]|nr:hypothetical protein [Bacteroidales bacterium]